MEENKISTVSDSSVLTWGILSLVFCGVPIWGLICAIIARKKAKTFALENGALAGKAKVGGILSVIGLICAIIMTVYWVIFGIIAIIGGAAASSYSYY